MRALALALWAFAAVNALDLALTWWGLAHGAAEGAPAAARVVARLGPLARRYPAQLPHPPAWIVGACGIPVVAAVALDVAALVGS